MCLSGGCADLSRAYVREALFAFRLVRVLSQHFTTKYRTFRCLHKGKDEIDHRWIKKFLENLGGAEAEVDKKVGCGTQFTGHCATISSGALKGASFFQAVISGWSTRWERKSLL